MSRELAALRKLDDDGDALRTIAAMFLRDTPPRLRLIEQGAAAGDLEVVRATAHTLRGAAASLGAHELVALVAEFERMVREGRCPGDEQLRALAAAWEQDRTRIEAGLESLL